MRVENVDEPSLLEPADALVRVTLCGICGTDLHLVGGDFSGVEPGVVLGHEIVGEVIAGRFRRAFDRGRRSRLRFGF